MTTAVAASAPLAFGETSVGSLKALRWLSPALLGLGAPMIAGLVLFPALLETARFAVLGTLGVLVAVAASVYTLSVLAPGNVSGLLIDPGRREVDVLRDGAFAVKQTSYAFADIADLCMVTGYDDDGYAFEAPEIVFAGGTVEALPATITRDDIAVARRALGLGKARR